MGKIIGIDLGTTNSCAAIVENGQVKLIPYKGGEFIIPSIFAIDEKGNELIGHEAKRQHAKKWPGTGCRILGQIRELPQRRVVPSRRRVVPLLRPGPEVDHEEAGLVPFGAVMIRIRTTIPHAITA